MVPKIRDVLELLEKVAPARFAEPWDNPGLQVGSYSQKVAKIFLALDPTLKALRAAYKRHAQLLLTHHPLIFTPLSRLDISVYPGNVILEAAKSGISVVAAHTNLDVAPAGINDILADLLELQHVEVLKEMGEMDGVGLGRIGDLPTPKKLSAVAKEIDKVLGVEKSRVVAKRDVKIRRLAVVGGSGGDLVSIASKKGADLLLTGDVSHHYALEAESLGVALIDAGHFHIEKTAFGIFSERLKDITTAQGWEVTVDVYKNETAPMRDALGD
jgi:dinuclear metal center YbgI/SA1388 family protein